MIVLEENVSAFLLMEYCIARDKMVLGVYTQGLSIV